MAKNKKQPAMRTRTGPATLHTYDDHLPEERPANVLSELRGLGVGRRIRIRKAVAKCGGAVLYIVAPVDGGFLLVTRGVSAPTFTVHTSWVAENFEGWDATGEAIVNERALEVAAARYNARKVREAKAS